MKTERDVSCQTLKQTRGGQTGRCKVWRGCSGWMEGSLSRSEAVTQVEKAEESEQSEATGRVVWSTPGRGVEG